MEHTYVIKYTISTSMTGPCRSCTEYVADNYRLQTTTDNPGKIQKLVYTEKKDK